MMLTASIKPVSAIEENMTEKTNMSFIEFLGEGVDVDKEYIDPLQVREYEEMMGDVQYEGKQQND